MAMFQASRNTAGSGGGLVITGWTTHSQTQETNFLPNTLSFVLPTIPIDFNAIVLDYDGQVLHVNDDWDFTPPQTINILFGDPYVDTYDAPPVFQAVYPI